MTKAANDEKRRPFIFRVRTVPYKTTKKPEWSAKRPTTVDQADVKPSVCLMFDPDLSHDPAPKRAARPSDVFLLLVAVAFLGVALAMIFERLTH